MGAVDGIRPDDLQVVIVPFGRGERAQLTCNIARDLGSSLQRHGISVYVDDDRPQIAPGAKFREWDESGIPVRLELGPRDVDNGVIVIVNALAGQSNKCRAIVSIADIVEIVVVLLQSG